MITAKVPGSQSQITPLQSYRDTSLGQEMYGMCHIHPNS